MFARSSSSSIRRVTYGLERNEDAASPTLFADSWARLVLAAIKPLLTRSDPGRAYTRICAALSTETVQGALDDVVQLCDVVVGEALALVLGDLADVALVSLRDDDPLDPRPLRGEGLLLHSPDRQHLPGERDLARHRDVVGHRLAADQGGERGGHRHPPPGSV